MHDDGPWRSLLLSSCLILLQWWRFTNRAEVAVEHIFKAIVQTAKVYCIDSFIKHRMQEIMFSK